jgi:allantoin racemase
VPKRNDAEDLNSEWDSFWKVLKLGVCLVASKKYYPESEVEARRKHLQTFASKDTEIEIIFPDEGTYWVDKPTEFDPIYIIPYIVKRIVQAEKEGFDAALVNCIIDPAVDAARCVVDMPVLGPGRTVMHVAGLLGDKAGFFCPSKLVPHIYRFAKAYDLGSIVHYVEPVDLGPTQFTSRKEQINIAFNSFAQRAIANGAQVLVPWGLPLLSAGGLDAKELTKSLKVPVLDAHSYVRIAEDLVRNGLSQSRLAYPSPPQHQVDSLFASMGPTEARNLV